MDSVDNFRERFEALKQKTEQLPDFSVVLFQSDFVLVSEEHPMKMHKINGF